jgi:hypothetical protein
METETGYEDLFDSLIAGTFDPEIGDETELYDKLMPLLHPLTCNDGPLDLEDPEDRIVWALIWFAQYVFKRGVYDPVGIMYRRGLEAQRPKASRRNTAA